MLIDDDLAPIAEEFEKYFRLSGTQNNTIYHYTTAVGLEGIISSKTLRATNILYLNDSKEYNYARDKIIDILSTKLSKLNSTKIVETSDHHQKLLAETTSGILENLSNRSEGPQIFVACFCQEGDRIDQWNSYGANGFGYSIGFSVERLNSLGLRIVEMHYGEDTIIEIIEVLFSRFKKIITKYINKTSDNDIVDNLVAASFGFINRIASCLKHEGFRHEREIRLITFGDGSEEELKFSLKGSIIVPFLDVDLQLGFADCISNVIVGPSSYKKLAASGVLTYLAASGLKNVIVQPSQQPYRVLR